jgi:hypothetical protein
LWRFLTASGSGELSAIAVLIANKDKVPIKNDFILPPSDLDFIQQRQDKRAALKNLMLFF